MGTHLTERVNMDKLNSKTPIPNHDVYSLNQDENFTLL